MSVKVEEERLTPTMVITCYFNTLFMFQGPVEVATVFLTEIVEGRAAPTRHHNKLRLCFKDFIKKLVDITQILRKCEVFRPSLKI